MIPARPDDLRERTRRHFFADCGVGVGGAALQTLLLGDARAAGAAAAPHHPARATRVIYLFMAGGPSQLDLFDHKPELVRRDGQPIPESFLAGKRFAFMNESHRTELLASRRAFARTPGSGMWISDLLPHTAAIADRLAFVRTCSTDLFNHAPAKLFMNTGTGRFGRPSIGSWVTYGLGSEAEDLPGFVVLQSGPRGPRGGAVLWGAGMLPSAYQGVALRTAGDPIPDLSSPAGVGAARQRGVVDAVNRLNRRRLAVTGDGEIAARISAYEMAFRMQSSAPELVDIAGESAETLALYGIREPGETTFARNCLLARRLVERGTRFVQLYHTNWDHHGGPTENLETHLPEVCGQIDRACAGLVVDLARRGLLEDTIVVWGGEFGRTPMGEKRESTGRNHHIDAFTMWFAGGGVRAGAVHGTTDDFGFGAAEGGVHVRDVHATLLHLLGLDHERLAVRFQGLDERLTGVQPARILDSILA